MIARVVLRRMKNYPSSPVSRETQQGTLLTGPGKISSYVCRGKFFQFETESPAKVDLGYMETNVLLP